MRGTGRFVAVVALLSLLGACGSGTGGSGQVASGGNSGSGGGVASGGVPGTGGQVGTGGAGTGGQASGTGGRAVPSGTGGTGSGGTNSGAGGAATGGSATGGAATGGAVAGTTATGGAVASTGGATTGAGGASPGTGGTPAVSMVVTSAEGAYWQPGTLTQTTGGTSDVTVYTFQTFQTFDGFGGSFTERGWTALTALSAGDQARAMDLLFGSQGLRFTTGRVPIGATDYSLDRYSLDMTDDVDYAMEHFSIARDMENLIPYIQAALDRKPDLHLIADPWTPPAWMKTGPFASSNTPSNYDGGNMKDDNLTLTAYSSYLAKFVEEYAKLGITIEAVAPQSDPTFVETFPSCVWTPALYLKFIRDYLGPRFLSEGVTAKVMVGMLANGDEDTDFATAVMADPAAMSFVSAFGLEDNMVRALSTLTASGLPVLQTEQDPGNDPFPNGVQPQSTFASIPANDYIFAQQSWQQISTWLNGGVSSYLVKHMALDTLGANLDSSRLWPQDALLVVDTGAQTLTITPAFYVLRHVAQFVDPGAIRLGVQAAGMLDPLAFQNPDGSIVTILYNPGPAAQPTVSIGGVTWQFSIPASGFATFVKRP